MFIRITSPLFVAGSLMLLAPAAHAQHSFGIGPRVGLNLATFQYAERLALGNPGYRPSLELGVAANLAMGHFALQAAALYSQKGAAQEYTIDVRTGTNLPNGTSNVEYHNRLNYLTIPVSLAFTQGSDGQGAQVFAGPYLGILLGGRYESTITPQSGGAPATQGSSITPVNSDAPELGGYARRFDAGLQGGVGYRYHALLLQVAYSMGLRNVEPNFFYNGVPLTSSAYYNRAFQGSLTYLFGKPE